MDKATVKMRGRLWGRRPEVKGHLECKALLLGRGAKAQAYPTLQSDVGGCNLTHEAAIGKISEDEMLYLMARGLTREEATSLITRGFLDVEIPGLPGGLSAEVRGIIMATMRGM